MNGIPYIRSVHRDVPFRIRFLFFRSHYSKLKVDRAMIVPEETQETHPDIILNLRVEMLLL